MAEHLGYELYESAGRGSGNSRSGSYPKTVSTGVGPVELQVPRDRQGTFEPVTVPKHVRRLEGLGANVLSLYAKGSGDGGYPRRIWLRSTAPKSRGRRSPRSPTRCFQRWSRGKAGRGSGANPGTFSTG
jgi:hypothetical protein